MTHQNAHQTVGALHEWLHREGYSESYVASPKTPDYLRCLLAFWCIFWRGEFYCVGD